MRIRDPEWKKVGSRMEKIRIRDKQPGSATLMSIPGAFLICTTGTYRVINVLLITFSPRLDLFTRFCLRIVNGRKVTTKKVMENGVETVTTYEDDVMKSRTVNGVPQQMQQQVSYLNSYCSSQGADTPPAPLSGAEGGSNL
jgi:hypothetical protein